MITATFKYKNTDYTHVVQYPQNPHGLKLNGRRPYRLELTGEYGGEDEMRLKKWVYGGLYRSLVPAGREMTVQVDNLPFALDPGLPLW